jgi:uncharacterized damage-inducible protein DinB
LADLYPYLAVLEATMDDLLADLRHEFQRHKVLAERAMAQLSDEQFLRRPGELVNPVALIVKHLAGNFASRWADFLTTDGEKPTRDRDGEFVLTDADTRENLMAAWECGWKILFEALDGMTDADLLTKVTIRGEVHSARQALLRGISHLAYHTGQILYVARLMRPQGAWLTVPPGQSKNVPGGYRRHTEPGVEARAK